MFARDYRHRELSRCDDVKFLYEIVKRNFTKAPRLRRFVNENRDKIVVLKSRKAIATYLNALMNA